MIREANVGSIEFFP